MFTGIISEIGIVDRTRHTGGNVRLGIRARSAATELRVNDSVCVNGVCQTVIAVGGDVFEMEAVEETLRKTTLGELKESSPVNLELPVKMADRLGGHLVLGHVDCVGTVTGIVNQPGSRLVTVEYPVPFSRYLVPVGSVAVDGISLTVATLEDNTFTVSIIPHTLEKTTIADAGKGTRVNLEFDIIGKYIERLLPSGRGVKGSTLDADKLRNWGYET